MRDKFPEVQRVTQPVRDGRACQEIEKRMHGIVSDHLLRLGDAFGPCGDAFGLVQGLLSEVASN